MFRRKFDLIPKRLPVKLKNAAKIGLLLSMLIQFSSLEANALERILIFNDYFAVDPNILTLDSDNSGGDIYLQFGETLAEQLFWDDSANSFVFTDDLEIEGTQITLDRDNTGTGSTVQIVANQGSESDGIIQYDSTDNRWEYSNDGVLFRGLGGATITSLTTTLVDQEQVTITHPADTDHERLIQVKSEISSPMDINTDTDFDTADESQFIQQNSSIGTDFSDNLLKLQFSSGPTVGTTNLALAGTASASTSSLPAANANNNNNTDYWYTTAGNATGGWLKIDLGAPYKIMRSTVRWFNTTGTYNCTTFNIRGSDDDSTYTTVWTGNSVGAQEQTYNFTPVTYRYWMFECAVANNGSYFVINEARLFEALYSYPTTAYYATTGTNSLDTSTWVGVNNFDITQYTPTNSSIRYLFSFDGRTTWKYYNGSAWVTSSLANLQTNGMTEATVEALSSAQWMAAGGINSNAAETLDMAFSLRTTTGASTPALDQISITYELASYWQIDPSLFQVREVTDTESLIMNISGATQNVVVDVWTP